MRDNGSREGVFRALGERLFAWNEYGSMVTPSLPTWTGAPKVTATLDALPGNERNTVVSVYDPKKQEIILAVGWTAVTPAEQAVLVHVIVHHLQYSAHLNSTVGRNSSQRYHRRNRRVRARSKENGDRAVYLRLRSAGIVGSKGKGDLLSKSRFSLTPSFKL